MMIVNVYRFDFRVNETFPDICPWPGDRRQGMDVYVTGAFRSRGERGGDGYRHVGMDTAAAAVIAVPADACRAPEACCGSAS